MKVVYVQNKFLRTIELYVTVPFNTKDLIFPSFLARVSALVMYCLGSFLCKTSGPLMKAACSEILL